MRKVGRVLRSGSSITCCHRIMPCTPSYTSAIRVQYAARQLSSENDGSVVMDTRSYAWGTEDEDRTAPIMQSPTFRMRYADTIEARSRLAGQIEPSACDLSKRLSRQTGLDLFLKKEHTHTTGSYKGRGVLNHLLSLPKEARAKGVVVASSGNLAVATSYHAGKLNIPCSVVMAKNTFATQITNSQSFGAKIVLHGESYHEARHHALELAKSSGATFIQPHHDRHTVAGYASVAHDLLRQNPYMDAVVLPVAGSLLGAMALVIKTVNPRVRVYGVESNELQDLSTLLKHPSGVTSDISPRSPDDLTSFEMVQKNVDGILLVNETQRAAAILALMEKEKTVVQGSGVAAVAALLSNSSFQHEFAGKQVIAVCTGGNIESSLLVRVIEKGLVSDGRVARIRVTIQEQQLAKVTSTLAKARANIREVSQERAFLTSEPTGYTQPMFTLEVRGGTHVEEILKLLADAGFEKAQLVSGPLPL